MDEHGIETRRVAFVPVAAGPDGRACEPPGDGPVVCVAATVRFSYAGPDGGLPPALSCDMPASSGDWRWERHGG